MAIPKELGPVEYIVVEFEQGTFEGKALAELIRLQEAGIVRVLDLMFVHRDAAGDLFWLDFDGLADVGVEIGSLPDDLVGLLSESDATELGAQLEPGQAIAIVVFEDTWATRLQAALGGAGGRLVEASRVPKDAVDAALAFAEQQMEEVG